MTHINHQIIAASGHRPHYLPHGITIGHLYNHAYGYLRAANPAVVISGMALGWDTAVAKAALDLNIKLWCAVPFMEQPCRWPTADILLWKDLQKRARAVFIISPRYSPECFQLRNEWMVDNCDRLLVLWNGVERGGTANCIAYAKSKGKPYKNMWGGLCP